MVSEKFSYKKFMNFHRKVDFYSSDMRKYENVRSEYEEKNSKNNFCMKQKL